MSVDVAITVGRLITVLRLIAVLRLIIVRRIATRRSGRCRRRGTLVTTLRGGSVDVVLSAAEQGAGEGAEGTANGGTFESASTLVTDDATGGCADNTAAHCALLSIGACGA